jgi:hypothetical protein
VKIFFLLTTLTLVVPIGCISSNTRRIKPADVSQAIKGEADILQSWQVDFPVAQLKLLPDKQRERAVGFIADLETFVDLWKVFMPSEDVPKIDFKANLALFFRNTQYYNPISIKKVKVKDGVAEVLAMETMPAMPIEILLGINIIIIIFGFVYAQLGCNYRVNVWSQSQ